MKKYFDVYLEFDHEKLFDTINRSVEDGHKGYMCVVDANIITTAQRDPEFKKIINSALVNTCDGSSIAILSGWIHKSKLRPFNGPEIFSSYIEKSYRHLLLGSTPEVKEKVIGVLLEKNLKTDNILTMELPFCRADQFDYKGIAEEIKNLNPAFIWVSLGAPKQEIFMSRLLPHLDKGFMIGIGAAFNFYIGDFAIPKARLGRLKFIWFSRIFTEPSKSISRISKALAVMPKMIYQELRRQGNH
jgi:N-acetylglucosaminyldiphosphoundecaprenol N-acetyl-beta-D-mannosaminyltransferase